MLEEFLTSRQHGERREDLTNGQPWQDAANEMGHGVAHYFPARELEKFMTMNGLKIGMHMAHSLVHDMGGGCVLLKGAGRRVVRTLWIPSDQLMAPVTTEAESVSPRRPVQNFFDDCLTTTEARQTRAEAHAAAVRKIARALGAVPMPERPGGWLVACPHCGQETVIAEKENNRGQVAKMGRSDRGCSSTTKIAQYVQGELHRAELRTDKVLRAKFNRQAK